MLKTPHLRGSLAILAATAIMAGFALVVLAVAPAPKPAAAPAPVLRNVGGPLSMRAPGANLDVRLPATWGVLTHRDGTAELASPSRCHTATLSVFADEGVSETVAMRAQHMLGYAVGGDYDSSRLRAGTVAGGRGFLVYDPKLLLGIEAVRHEGRRYIVMIQGSRDAKRAQCADAGAAQAQRELSRLIRRAALQ